MKSKIYESENYENESERVDIFYGRDRVYLTLICSKKTRNKFADFVDRTKEWTKVKEVSEIPIYTKKINLKRNIIHAKRKKINKRNIWFW